MDKNKSSNRIRQRRTWRVRNHLRKMSDRPRLSVSRTLKHIGCLIIDDAQGLTVVSVSTRDKALREQIGYGGNCKAAEVVGRIIAERALAAGVSEVVFDRGHNRYHGRIAALAEAARKAGLKF